MDKIIIALVVGVILTAILAISVIRSNEDEDDDWEQEEYIKEWRKKHGKQGL